MWAKAAAAKLKLDRQSYAEFRAIDQQLHEQAHKARTEAAVKLYAEDLPYWREDAAQAKAEAEQALAAAREAEDKALEAAEFAVQAKDAYRKIKDTGSPAEVTEALTAAQNALTVAQDRGRAAEEAAKTREDANALLVTSREELAGAEARLAQAQRAASTPAGVAPLSDATITANFAHMQRDEVWATLSRADQRRVTAVARDVRAVPVTREEFEMFKERLDASATAGARREAAQSDNRSVPIPLLRPTRIL
jgi:hypothetical protein